MPTLRNMTFRTLLYANGEAYDIGATIDILRHRSTGPVVDECISSLQRMQFGPRVEDFMLSLDNPNCNVCIPLEVWLHRFAVQVIVSDPDGYSLGSDSILSDDTDYPTLNDEEIESLESFDDVIEETHARAYGNRQINSDVVASFMNLRYGHPTIIGRNVVRPDLEPETEEECIEEE